MQYICINNEYMYEHPYEINAVRAVRNGDFKNTLTP